MIKRLQRAIRKAKLQKSWAIHFGIALGFVAIAMGYLIHGSVISAQAQSNPVTVSKPVANAVYYIESGGPFGGSSQMTIEWRYANWTPSGSYAADIRLQAQDEFGNWYNRADIVLNDPMGKNPDTYIWPLTDESLVGEGQRIAVTVWDSGTPYTGYSSLIYLRKSGVNFITPEGGELLEPGTVTRIRFYWHSQLVPLQYIWVILSYRDKAGAYQEITKKFDHQWPVEPNTQLKYHDWLVPETSEIYKSKFKVSLYIQDDQGQYTALFMQGESNEFSIGRVPAQLDFSVDGMTFQVPHSPIRKGEEMKIVIDLGFWGNRDLVTTPVELYVRGLWFMSPDFDDPNPVRFEEFIEVPIGQFDLGSGHATLAVPVEVAGRYLQTGAFIDWENVYYETDEANNLYPRDGPRLYIVDEYYEVALRLVTDAGEGEKKTVYVGDEFDVELRLDLGEHQAAGVKYSIEFDPTYLEVAKDDEGNCLITNNLWMDIDKGCDNQQGKAWGNTGIELLDISPPDGEWDYTLTGDDIPIATIKFRALEPGYTYLDFKRDSNGEMIDNEVTSIGGKGGAGGPIDPEIVVGSGAVVDILPAIHIPVPAEGTYYSKAFAIDITDPTYPLDSLRDFTAAFDNPGGSIVKFSIQFQDSAGQPLGIDPEHPDAWYQLFASSNLPYDTSYFEIYSWFSDIRKVRFSVFMSTLDVTDADVQPWVRSLSLEYVVRSEIVENIGVINFVPVGGAQKSVQQGAEAEYDISITSLNNHSEAVQLAISLDAGGVVSKVTASISSPVGGVITLNPSAPVSAKIKFVAALDAPLTEGTPYQFTISGVAVGQPDLALTTLSGWLEVTSAGGTGNFSLIITDDYKNPQPGAVITFNIAVTRTGGFSEDIALSHNLSTAASAIVDLDPTKTYFTPQTLLPNQSTANLRVKIKDTIGSGDLDKDFVFTITGTAVGSGGTATDTATIKVSQQGTQYPAITVNAVIPAEGGRSSSMPIFIFRLYEKGTTSRTAYTFSTDFAPSKFSSGDNVRIAIGEGVVKNATTYVGYARTNRHLWSRATSPTGGEIAINSSGATHPNYSLTFPRLSAGNIAPLSNLNDDIINSLDYTLFLQEWSKLASTILGDFNNDGLVNAADLSGILGVGKFFKLGDLATNIP
ncbi:hypothetical protein A2V68_02445 [candidate division Kazan bacterium RBG_13_50_9]|uniref:Dockerin domain-containing protein n=1 Tax=candidate division Kazan bacterium RBG_13_50_9 TaxID=1798535 RepID=A0A1F4NRR8_UNCK3|nr:MAG: hypothetical protein A2V68_02445 [candidate division Kazan bacterium RBG_13_50_9]